MKPDLASVLSEIADSLTVDDGYRFGPSPLQAKLDALDINEDSIVVAEREAILDLVHAEYFETQGYDELPEDIQPLMLRMAWDAGPKRANILLQAIFGSLGDTCHITGELTAENFALADKHAARLVSAFLVRRAIFDSRMELLNEGL